MRLSSCAALLLVLTTAGCAATEEEDAEDSEAASGAIGTLPETVIYPSNATQSPITPAIAQRLRAIRAAGPSRNDGVFAKVGDSQTVSTGFMSCFTSAPNFDGVEDGAALEATRRFFLGGAAGRTTFARKSVAAKIGERARFPLGGPLDQEVSAINPGFAVVMYGSNDIQFAPTGGMVTYARDMLKITDALVAKGIVPLLTSPPPRPFRAVDRAVFGPAGADVWAPRFANVVRTIAQARQVPFIDLERELRAIDGFGIGSDDLHLNQAPRGACEFDQASMRFGHNVRNLATLTALDRARAAVDARASFDSATSFAGSGASSDPIRVASLPFGDLRGLPESRETSADKPCGSASPARFTYRIQQASAGSVHLGLFAPTRGPRLFVRSGGRCQAVDNNDDVVTLAAGQHDLVVTGGTTGEFIVTATPSR